VKERNPHRSGKSLKKATTKKYRGATEIVRVLKSLINVIKESEKQAVNTGWSSF